MQTKTIRELSAMSSAEIQTYLQSLPDAEKRAIDEELNHAIELATSRNLVDSHNENTDNLRAYTRRTLI